MRKLTNLQKTVVALAAASLLIGSQAYAGGGVVVPDPTCDTGVVRTSGNALVWALDTNRDTTADIGPFPYGTAATDSPITGDWDNNGTDNVGVTRVNGSSLIWRLDTNSGGAAEIIRAFGNSTDTPVAGDYSGSATVQGVTRTNSGSATPNALIWKLDTADDGGTAETTIVFGNATDQPITGDWDDDGDDDIGVIRQVSGLNKAFLDTNGGGTAEIILNFGPAGSSTLACDWDGNGTDNLTSVAAGGTTLRWKLDTGNNGGVAEDFRAFGATTGDTPVAGDWDNM